MKEPDDSPPARPVSPEAGAPGDGPRITAATLCEAEKLAGLAFTDAERAQVLNTMDRLKEAGRILQGVTFRNDEGLAEDFDPRVPGVTYSTERRAARWPWLKPGPLPKDDADIAFSPVGALGHWIQARQLSSERLTRIYLTRLKRWGAALECVVTLTEETALEQARRADEELARGRHRGPLHGIPWGAKDIIDTAGIPTTWGVGRYRDRTPERSATVVERLERGGAVLVAKLSVGELANGDVWFGGKTRNPWKLDEGSRGSSAGSAAAVAAGLVGFSLGSETYGSIASPCARCGASGFRPTFGRVSRSGVMALGWSLDKVGPIARTVEDCARVLDAIAGPDPRDRTTVEFPLNIDMTASPKGVRVGYDPAVYAGDLAGEADRHTLEALQKSGAELVSVTLPDGPYHEVLLLLIQVEAAAAFDAMTRRNLDDGLRGQTDDAWPNTWRRTRFVPAVDYLQARRLRRRFMHEAAALFSGVDVIVTPRRHRSLHPLTNMTGNPAVTLRHQFMDDGSPRGVTLWGKLYGDATLLRIGATLEEALNLGSRRPSPPAAAPG